MVIPPPIPLAPAPLLLLPTVLLPPVGLAPEPVNPTLADVAEHAAAIVPAPTSAASARKEWRSCT
jgi:hypothetical protein